MGQRGAHHPGGPAQGPYVSRAHTRLGHQPGGAKFRKQKAQAASSEKEGISFSKKPNPNTHHTNFQAALSPLGNETPFSPSWMDCPVSESFLEKQVNKTASSWQTSRIENAEASVNCLGDNKKQENCQPLGGASEGPHLPADHKCE